MHTALDSSERFDLFIQIKSSELEGNDATHNYFWALQIRHDQILAVLAVIKEILLQLQTFIQLPIKALISEEDFLSLGMISIEDRVYLMAEKIYKERTS
jgi:hypothetical protein